MYIERERGEDKNYEDKPCSTGMSERQREKERKRELERDKERKREKESVCVCEKERERERETERETMPRHLFTHPGKHIYRLTTALQHVQQHSHVRTS